MRRADRLGFASAALEPDDLDLGVAAQQADELGADVAGRTDDPDADPLAGARPAVRRDLCARLETRAHWRARPLTGGRLLARNEGIGWTAVMTA
jgi:hypothetical protein